MNRVLWLNFLWLNIMIDAYRHFTGGFKLSGSWWGCDWGQGRHLNAVRISKGAWSYCLTCGHGVQDWVLRCLILFALLSLLGQDFKWFNKVLINDEIFKAKKYDSCFISSVRADLSDLDASLAHAVQVSLHYGVVHLEWVPVKSLQVHNVSSSLLSCFI